MIFWCIWGYTIEMHVSVSILAWCMGCILTLKVHYFPSSASVFESLGDPCLEAWFSESNSWILNYFIVLERDMIGLSHGMCQYSINRLPVT